MTSSIDSVISSAVKESSKLSMAKTLFDGRAETTITGEKGIGFKRNSNTFGIKMVILRLRFVTSH